MPLGVPLTLTLALAALSSPAHACGGFFCNAVDPVDQAGEVIVFDVDDDDELVTMHVKVAYEGPAEAFAWVVPVPANPSTFISPGVLFTELDARTTPRFDVLTDFGACQEPYYDYSDASTVVDSATPPGGVDVVSTGRVGPYDQAVLQAADADVLVDWLQANGYAVPDSLADALDPYVGPDTHFLALRLTKGNDTGDLEPLGMSYAGTTPAIPIGLTAVAATPDMPLRVYLLGESRGVPLNYLHVQVNPLAMPWFAGTSWWEEAIGRAANEAGGHAFATTYAGTDLNLSVYFDQFDLDGLSAITSARPWFEQLAYRGFGGTDELLDVLRVHVPAPPTVDETSFYNWPGDYATEWAALDATFDSVAATADLDSIIVQPRIAAQAILDANPWLTRLETRLSPEEMTVDPRFGFNADLSEVPLTHTATLRYEDCAPSADPSSALRSLELPTGHTIGLPSEATATATTTDLLIDMVVHYGLVVEQLSESGPPEVIADHTSELDALEAATSPPDLNPWGFPVDPTRASGSSDGDSERGGCGCVQRPTAGPSVWMLGGLGSFARRR